MEELRELEMRVASLEKEAYSQPFFPALNKYLFEPEYKVVISYPTSATQTYEADAKSLPSLLRAFKLTKDWIIAKVDSNSSTLEVQGTQSNGKKIRVWIKHDEDWKGERFSKSLQAILKKTLRVTIPSKYVG